jgi:hypothetical protein
VSDRLLRVGGFALALAALWMLWDTPVLYPLKLLVVLFHEVSHALAAVATGGEIREIAVTADQGGWCDCPGGNAFLTLSAGYLGSLAWGALLVESATGPGRLRQGVLAGLGLLLGVLTLGYVRRPLTLLLGLAAGGGLLWAALRLRAEGRKWVLAVLGTVSCLYALLDVKSDVLERPGAASDASALAALTGIPTLVWGVLWILVSVAVVAGLFRRAWRRW